MNKEDTHAGQAVYTKTALLLYDLFVLGFSNRFVWKCNTALIGTQFYQLTSSNHMDIGVGTGFYLKKYLPKHIERIALADLNPNCLSASQDAIAHLKPEVYQQDILKPFTCAVKPFDSISINYLLHCLPGDFLTKSTALFNIKSILKPNGVLFGCSILGKGIQSNTIAKFLLRKYNQKGIFSNLDDDLKSLETVLKQHFSSVKVDLIGNVALFKAK